MQIIDFEIPLSTNFVFWSELSSEDCSSILPLTALSKGGCPLLLSAILELIPNLGSGFWVDSVFEYRKVFWKGRFMVMSSDNIMIL